MFRASTLLLFVLAVLLPAAPQAMAQEVEEELVIVVVEEPLPAVNSFIFYVDYSPSMDWEHKTLDVKKLDLAVDAMKSVVAELPQVDGFHSAVYRFNDFRQEMPTTLFQRRAVLSVLDNLPMNYYDYDKMFRSTNIDKALALIDPVVKGNWGPTALILVTDGKSTAGFSPSVEAKRLKDKYGPNLCIHAISVADTAEGEADIAAIREASGPLYDCSAFATAEDLADSEKMDAFIAKAFYTPYDPTPYD